MENKLLQPLLQAGLLDIGDSDERLANIEKSIDELQKKFTEDHHLLERYTLAGLDPEISQNENVVVEVEGIISVYWKALRAKFSERPVSIIRAVILSALYNAGIADAYIARIVYLAASNFYPFSKMGREEEIVKRMIAELGDLAEAVAVQEWSLNEVEQSLKLPELKITGLQFIGVEVDDRVLREELSLAGKYTPQGHNPYQHPAEWSAHFASHAGDGIVDSIKTTVDKIGSMLSPSSIEIPLNKYFAEFRESLDQVLKISLNSLTAVERRSKLLWWKETLYSASLKTSYRVLPSELQPLILACDLFDQLPAIVPVSVDFLLKDTLLLLNIGANDKTTFADFFKIMLTFKNKKVLQKYFTETNISGRIGVTDFIKLAVYDKVNISSFKDYTGINDNSEITYGDIAVIVLHDLFINSLSD